MLTLPGTNEYYCQWPWVYKKRVDHTGTGRVHGASVAVIEDVEKLGQLKWSVGRNGSILDLFKWRGYCDKFRKKAVKCAGIFCGNFCVGREQYPPCQMVRCRGCYAKHPNDDLPKSGKVPGGYWE